MLCLIYCFVCVLTIASSKNYSGYKAISVQIQSRNEATALLEIGNRHSVDFLTVPITNRTSNIIVGPADLEALLNDLQERNLIFLVNEQDFESMIQEERNEQARLSTNDGFRRYRPFKNLRDIFVKYPRYAEIVRWMKQVTKDFPQIARVEQIGKTYDGKPMTILKLSGGSEQGGRRKKVIWIDGAIHGREWISATTVLYIANKVLESYSAGDPRGLLDQYDWMFLPVANPDGYEFSHSTDRLWRKNRRPIVAGCYGVDLNRNFGLHWGETKGSVSSQGCSIQYGGRGPFSEPETMNMRDYLVKLRGRLEVYLSFHSYSQLWLVPWGYTSNKPADYKKLYCVAKSATKAAKSINGLNYKVGTLSELLYAAAGGSFDWAKSDGGATYSYTVELRPTPEKVGPVVDRGFLATTEEILPAGEEMWAAVQAMISVIKLDGCRQ